MQSTTLKDRHGKNGWTVPVPCVCVCDRVTGMYWMEGERHLQSSTSTKQDPLLYVSCIGKQPVVSKSLHQSPYDVDSFKCGLKSDRSRSVNRPVCLKNVQLFENRTHP